MLEGVAVELRVVVEVVGVGKEIVARTEYVAATNVRTWQSHLLRLGYLKAILGLAVKGFPHFVTEVGVGAFVSDNLYGVIHTCGAMVGGQHDLIAQ